MKEANEDPDLVAKAVRESSIMEQTKIYLNLGRRFQILTPEIRF